jgi:hypothetical protein
MFQTLKVDYLLLVKSLLESIFCQEYDFLMQISFRVFNRLIFVLLT